MIHPTALVEPGAELAPDVQVGPFALIGAQVKIDAGTFIAAHAVIEGRTRIGRLRTRSTPARTPGWKSATGTPSANT